MRPLFGWTKSEKRPATGVYVTPVYGMEGSVDGPTQAGPGTPGLHAAWDVREMQWYSGDTVVVEGNGHVHIGEQGWRAQAVTPVLAVDDAAGSVDQVAAHFGIPKVSERIARGLVRSSHRHYVGYDDPGIPTPVSPRAGVPTYEYDSGPNIAGMLAWSVVVTGLLALAFVGLGLAPRPALAFFPLVLIGLALRG